jgi:hypothetical protein
VSAAVLAGLLATIAVSGCGASTTTVSRTPDTEAVRSTGGPHAARPSTTTTTTELPSTTLLTIPPAPTPVGDGAPTTVAPIDAPAGSQQCSSPPTVTMTAQPDTTLDDLFQAYGDAGTGTTWTGGDETESVALGAGRELWFFSDTYLGRISNGVWIRPGSRFLHNTIVVERKGVLTRTLYKHHRSGPTAFVNANPRDPADYGFWPGPMVVNGRTLQVVGLDMRFGANGAFSVLGNSLATFALPSLNLVDLQTLPPSATIWSGGVLVDGGYTYVYGTDQSNTYAARVAGTNLSAPWSYYDGTGWTSDPTAAAPIETIGTEGHFSVAKVGGVYVFITKSSWTTDEITASVGCSPVGPFGPPQPVYATPEGSKYPSGYGVVTYGALAHPELSHQPDTLVVSYDVGPEGPQRSSITNPAIYRPRFLDLTIS